MGIRYDNERPMESTSCLTTHGYLRPGGNEGVFSGPSEPGASLRVWPGVASYIGFDSGRGLVLEIAAFGGGDAAPAPAQWFWGGLWEPGLLDSPRSRKRRAFRRQEIFFTDR